MKPEGSKLRGDYGIWMYIVTDTTGLIWISNLEGNVYTIDPSSKKMSPPIIKNVNYLTKVGGSLVINKYGKVLELENQEWKLLTKESESITKKHGIVDVTVSPTGRIWGRSRTGVSVYSLDGSWVDFLYDPAMIFYPDRNFVVDQSDRVWVGCQGGLWMFDLEKGWIRYAIKGSELVKSKTEQQTSIVRSLVIDSKGMMWVSAGSLVGVLDTKTIP